MEITSIIFDLGGVIVNLDPTAYIRTLPFSEEEKKEVYDLVCHDPIWKEMDEGKYKGYQDALPEMKERNPGREKEIDIFFRDGWMKNYFLLEKGLELYNTLSGKGYDIYILSNFSLDGYQYLKEHYDFFEKSKGSLISSKVHLTKPDRRIYRLMIEKFDLFAENSLIIDDNKDNIKTAQSLGFHTVLYREDTIDQEIKKYSL